MKKILSSLVKVGMFVFIWGAANVFLPSFHADSDAKSQLFSELVPLLVCAVLTLVFAIIEEFKVRPLKMKKPVFALFIGLLTGIFVLGIPVAVQLLLKGLSFGDVNPVSNLLWWVAAIFVNCLTQALLVHGYIYRLIEHNFNSVIAVLFSTAVSLVFNYGCFKNGIFAIVATFAGGLFLSLLLYATDCILAPILFNFLWYGVGGIVLGVTPLDAYPFIISTEVSGNQLISGGDLRLGGSVICIAVFFVAALVCFIVGIVRRGKKKDTKKQAVPAA